MSPESYLWIKAAHLFGLLVWLGSMLGLTQVLSAYRLAEGPGRASLGGVGRRLGLLMDLGATLSIACGVLLIVGSPAAPLKQPYLHIKLTVVAVLVVGHALIRVQSVKARRGRDAGAPGWAAAAVLLLALAIVWLAVVKPLARG
jgi:uncharacterized membrane protein